MAIQPTPPQLFDEFEAGAITREQLHSGLAFHARQLVEEIIETQENPLAAWWDAMLAKRLAERHAERHGPWRIRHILAALAEVPDFEPAHLLWNALHADVPLHCFFRMRREPVFRLVKIQRARGGLRVSIEHGPSGKHPQRESFLLLHQGHGFEAQRLPLPKQG